MAPSEIPSSLGVSSLSLLIDRGQIPVYDVEERDNGRPVCFLPKPDRHEIIRRALDQAIEITLIYDRDPDDHTVIVIMTDIRELEAVGTLPRDIRFWFNTRSDHNDALALFGSRWPAASWLRRPEARAIPQGEMPSQTLQYEQFTNEEWTRNMRQQMEESAYQQRILGRFNSTGAREQQEALARQQQSDQLDAQRYALAGLSNAARTSLGRQQQLINPPFSIQPGAINYVPRESRESAVGLRSEIDQLIEDAQTKGGNLSAEDFHKLKRKVEEELAASGISKKEKKVEEPAKVRIIELD